ncbi:MAG: antitoxin [Actinomycetota bacterium]|nr:antitoxin [Actinomycetota bacterium]
MALIQIRDVPEETYETIRRRARQAGQSIQAYMLARTVEFARYPTADEVIDDLERELAKRPQLAIDTDQLLADIRSGRPE